MKYTLLLLLCTVTSLVQNISGRVTDRKNNPIPGATVSIAKSTMATSTDENGSYLLTGLSEGTYKVIFSALGFERRTETFNIQGSPVKLDIQLIESAEQLQTIEVICRKETDYKNIVSFIGTKSATLLKDVPQSISFVTKELMLDQAAFRLNDVVKNMSGVNQFSFYNDITIRGHRVQGQQNSSILINGQRAFTSFWKQQLIPHIERVEVIKGPASAMFGNASAGGPLVYVENALKNP